MRTARGERSAAPRAEGSPRAAVASGPALTLVAEERGKAPPHVRLIMPAEGFVGDSPNGLAEAPLERRALFWRVEALAVGFADEQHIGERPRALEKLGHRRRPARPDEIVRVLTLGQQREAQAFSRADQRQRHLYRAEGRLA